MTIYNIPDHIRGDTWDGIILTLSADGVPVNLTSVSSIVAEFRPSVDAPVALTFTTANSSLLVIEPLSGVVQFTSRVIEVPFQIYYYDVQVNYTNGTKKTRAKGSWKITPDITE